MIENTARYTLSHMGTQHSSLDLMLTAIRKEQSKQVVPDDYPEYRVLGFKTDTGRHWCTLEVAMKGCSDLHDRHSIISASTRARLAEEMAFKEEE